MKEKKEGKWKTDKRSHGYMAKLKVLESPPTKCFAGFVEEDRSLGKAAKRLQILEVEIEKTYMEMGE